MISIPEIGAWGTEVYMLYKYSTFGIFVLAGAGLALHILLNIVYSYVHNRVIYHHSHDYHLEYYENHRPCN